MKRLFMTLGILFLVSFVFHIVWESSHVGLYGGYEEITALPITVWATIGDVFYTLSAFLLIALFKRRADWLELTDIIDFGVVAFVGLVIALFVEYKALAFNRWYYLDAMPIVPILSVGLSPLVQMTVLLPLSFLVTRSIMRLFLPTASR